MHDNPYESSIADSVQVFEAELCEDASRKAQRPVGIAILAILNSVVGLILVGVLFVVLMNWGDEDGPLGAGLPPAALAAIVALFIGIVTAAAVGLWFGARWGWWLGAFYFMYNVVRHAFFLVMGIVLDAQNLLPDNDIGERFMTHGVRLSVGILLVAYFFKRNVLQFFRLSAMSKSLAIAILAASAIAVTAVLIGLVGTMGSDAG